MMVMVDESTGNKYMRALSRKGLGPDGDNNWVVKDMHQELKSWRYPGGERTANRLSLRFGRRWLDATGGGSHPSNPRLESISPTGRPRRPGRLCGIMLES